MDKQDVVTAVQQFFCERHFHHVMPYYLQTSLPLEPDIYAFHITFCIGGQDITYYLPTSPEADCKKALAQGIENCFSISHAFRDQESESTIHTPSFLMCEWYRKDETYISIIHDVEALILFVLRILRVQQGKDMCSQLHYQRQTIHLRLPWKTVTMGDLFKTYAHTDLDSVILDEEMTAVAGKKGYSVAGATWEQLFHQIFLNEIEPKLGADPVFITDYPARISPLCKPKKSHPAFAERFELYLGGMEIANGNTENTDVTHIANVFREEAALRLRQGKEAPPIDTEFLDALACMNTHSYAGCGLGIDRLTMLLDDRKDIHDLDSVK